MKGKKKVVSMKGLRDKLDRVFSRYIRLRDADENGTVACVTCGKLAHWKEVHAGHFIKRQHMSVRWDERNVAAQCVRCNLHMGGQQDVFSKVILDAHGADVLSELLCMKGEVRKWTRQELADLIAKYESAARERESKLTV